MITKAYYKLISYDKIRFIVIGGVGFIVNYLGLALFFQYLTVPIVAAQVISAELAILATFIGNNLWTFKGHKQIPLVHKLIKFHISATAGFLINSGFVIVLVNYAHLYYGLSLIVGSLAGLIWNYTLYKRFVFSKKERESDKTDQ